MGTTTQKASSHQPGLLLEYTQSVSDNSWGPLTHFVSPEREPFFARSGWCPYCRTEIPKIFDRHGMSQPEGHDDPCREEYYATCVWSCQGCGWWDMFDTQNSGHDSVDPVYVSETLRHAVLRTYAISDFDLPIAALRSALRRQGDKLLHIRPAVMEDLVASVLRDYFPNCVARVCGRPGDRGIDLVLVESDRTVAVQIKRRSQPEAVERVMQVREFLGASLVERFQNLIYVSTADHFSTGHAGAQQFAMDAVDRRVVESFELIDRHRFLDMLRVIPREPEEPWRAFLPEHCLQETGS